MSQREIFFAPARDGAQPARVVFPVHLTWKKISAERAALSCRRPDGSTTWSRLNPFFPAHDLTHFAVETTLELRRGFFGLLAEGWNLDDFAQRGIAARLPEETHRAEVIVGVFEGLAVGAAHEEFCASLVAACAGQRVPVEPAVTAEQFAEIIRVRRTLRRQWAAVPIGESLQLAFAPVRVQAA